MRIKSYFAATVEAAMAKARQEMGPDAMLMNSRKSLPEARQMGEYEVVFAFDEEAVPTPPKPAASPVVASETAYDASGGLKTQSSANTDPLLAHELAELRRQMASMQTAIARAASRQQDEISKSCPELVPLKDTLTDSGLSPELVRDVMENVSDRISSRSAHTTSGHTTSGHTTASHPSVSEAKKLAKQEGGWRMYLKANRVATASRAQDMAQEELVSRFQVAPPPGQDQKPRRVMALIGPPGAGKTTTLVKIAVAHGLSARRPVQLLSMDNYRIAAIDQLRTYAAILGVGFQPVETASGLSQALAEHHSKELILIDTPGFGPADMEAGSELAAFFAHQSNVEVHLVLPSHMKAADMRRALDRYRVLEASRLIFTKLDETSTYGPLVEMAIQSRLPVSFLTDGQRVPEDLHVATREKLVQLLLNGEPEQARSAA